MRVTATWLESHQTLTLIDGETWCFSEKRFCYTSFTIFCQTLLSPSMSDHDPDELMQILCMYLLTTWKRAWRKHAQCTYQWFWSLWNMTHIYIQCCGKFWDKSLVSQHSVNHQQQPWNTLCRNGTMHCNGASGQLCSVHHGTNQCAPVQLFVASAVSPFAFKLCCLTGNDY